MDDIKPRLLKGLHHFWNIPPSRLNQVTWVHFHEYLKLLDLYLNGRRELTVENMTIEEIEKTFK